MSKSVLLTWSIGQSIDRLIASEGLLERPLRSHLAVVQKLLFDFLQPRPEVFDDADEDGSGEIDIHELHRIVLLLAFC